MTIGRKALNGLCRRCADRAYRALRLTVAEPRTTPSCGRCGVPGAALCDDCLDVAADLRELGRWVA